MNKQKIQSGGFGNNKTKQMLDHTAEMLSRNTDISELKHTAQKIKYNRNIDEKGAGGIWDFSLERIKDEFGHNTEKISDLEYLQETLYNKLWERLDKLRKCASMEYQAVIITDENGIIFQILVEKERVDDFINYAYELVNDYYDKQHTDYEDYESIYDYLDEKLGEEDGIVVNEVSIR